MHFLRQILFGLIISGLIGYAGYRKDALAPSGVCGAMLVGTLIFGCGGWTWGLLLITFFVLSSALSYYKQPVKQALAEKFDKGARRDLGQTLANGGAGALIALAYALYPHPALFAAFIGALATVNADTWATEIGVLSRRPPRLITTGHVVEPGTSGGISLHGTLATLAGGTVIGLAAALFALTAGSDARSALAALPLGALGGLAGSLCDSLLGATVQVIYYSTPRQKETEKRSDPDGTPNRRLRGWSWFDNDLVNFVSSLVGAGVAALAWGILL